MYHKQIIWHYQQQQQRPKALVMLQEQSEIDSCGNHLTNFAIND